MRGNLLVLTITRSMGMFCRGMAFPYASLYILSLGSEPGEIGLINAVSPLAGLLVFPIAGYLSDHAGRVKLIALAGYLSSAVMLLYVLATGWQAIALAQFLIGFMVFQFPPTSAIIADSISPENRGRGMAAMNTFSSATAIAAPYVAGAMLDARGVETGMRILYGILMGYNLLSATIHLVFLKETSPQSSNGFGLSDVGSILKTAYAGILPTLRSLPRSLRALAGVIALGFVSNGIASSFWVVFANEQIRLTSSQWGLILLVETSLRALMYVPAGWVVDHWGRARTIVSSLALALVSIPAFVFVRGFAAALLVRAVVATATAFFITACPVLMADTVPRDMRGRVMAALGRGAVFLGAASGGTGGPGVGFVITIPLMLASLTGGYLYAANPRLPWLVVTVALVLSLALAGRYIRDPQKAEV